MTKHTDGVDMHYAKDRQAWRNWLEKHHSKKKAVWLVFYRSQSGKTGVGHVDAVEEALCFGWIDSKKMRLDEHKSLQFFTHRKPKSNWSKINKEKVDFLIKQGKMTPSGLEVIETAKKNGSWNALDEVEKLIIPDDLLRSLKKKKKAHAYFMDFPKSSKKMILQWIYSAKQMETRAKRVEETTKLAERNIRANHPGQPKRKVG